MNEKKRKTIQFMLDKKFAPSPSEAEVKLMLHEMGRMPDAVLYSEQDWMVTIKPKE